MKQHPEESGVAGAGQGMLRLAAALATRAGATRQPEPVIVAESGG